MRSNRFVNWLLASALMLVSGIGQAQYDCNLSTN